MTSVPDHVGSVTYAPPIVTGPPIPVSDRVFVVPDNRVSLVPNIGFVVGDRSVLVVDTGVGVANGAHVYAQARDLAPGRSVYLAITQLDPGHGFGSQAFADGATIVFSAAQRVRLHNHADAYAESFRTLGREVADRLDGLALTDPHVVYDQRLELDLGGVRAVLRSWGPAHTGDDATVLVDDRVLFTGDLLQTRMFPILPYFPPFDTDFDGDRWIDALGWMLRTAPAVVVPGHGEVTDLDQVRQVHEYLVWVRSQVAHLRAAADLAGIGDAVEAQALARWPDWEVPRWIRTVVKAFYETGTDR